MRSIIAVRDKFIFLISIFMLNIFLTSQLFASENLSLNDQETKKILSYISQTWSTLRRSTLDCKCLLDPKTHITGMLYLPADFPLPEDLAELNQRCPLSVKRLPSKILKMGDLDIRKIETHGLLYLPHSYIVPGGIFNEMYGWDSYFIILGLIESQQLEMAYGMIENFFFEIEYYGGVLNGNRTYYLSRSQPPFLTSMIRAIYAADEKRKFTNLGWLAKAYSFAIKDYNLWTSGAHLAGNTTLSRYFDFGEGPVPELTDSAESYYVDITRYFLLQPDTLKTMYLKQHGKTSIACQETKRNFEYKCTAVKDWQLNNYFYSSDRAMRESGFDTSFRFGPYSADTINYAPVDLNSLLYKTEVDLEWMSEKLGLVNDKTKWQELAEKRRNAINKYFWNEKQGLYFDYNFITKQQSKYLYATTFYPLWTGVATPEQATKVLKNLSLFEKQGGIVTSPYETGVQWDYPYGWAPIQLITVDGLKHYGFKEDADRITRKFLQMVIENYLYDKTIREKYDVVSKTAKTNIQVGYKENMTGFGWTNGVFLVLLRNLNEN